MVQQKSLKTNKKTFAQIQQAWQDVLRLDGRSQLKALPTIGHDIYVSYDKATNSLAELEFYMQILKFIIKRSERSVQKNTRFLSKLYIEWLRLTGNEKAEVIFKKSGKILLVSALISIVDLANITSTGVNEALSSGNNLQLLECINQGKVWFFSTGSDGVHDIQFRVVDSTEPVVSEKEFRYVEDSSGDAVIVNIPTGKIIVGDPVFVNAGSQEECMLVTIPPGNYKVCVYRFLIPAKLDSAYIVLCKTEQEAKNNLSKLYGWG